MRTRCVTLLVAAAAVMFLAASAEAQVFCIPVEDESGGDPNDVAACSAATNTPFGALPTLLPASWMGRESTRMGFNFRFGSMDEEGDAGRRNFGIGLEIPAGRASIGLTGGFIDYTCDVPDADVKCESAIMLGGRFAMPLVANPISGGGAGQSFIVGLNGSVGFATGDILDADFFGERLQIGGRGISVGVGVPLGLVAKSGNVAITPFIEPAFFWGQTKFDVSGTFGSGEETESGTGFALGGGISLLFANGLSLDLGFKKVMIDEANALIGVSIGFQR
jgi:hypothetical protein